MIAPLIALSLVCSVFAEPKPVARIDEPFPQEIPTLYTEKEGLPAGSAYDLVLLPSGNPVASVGGKLVEFDGQRWNAIPNGPEFDVTLLAADGETLWAAGDSKLAKRSGDAWQIYTLPDQRTLIALEPHRDGCLIGTDAGLWTTTGKPIPAPAEGIIDIESDGERVVLAMASGLMIQTEESPTTAPYPTAMTIKFKEQIHHPRNIKAVAAEHGNLWYGDDNSVGVLSDGEWTLYTGDEGLPYTHFTCAVPGETTGVIWFGTARGAIRFDGKEWLYRAGKRWVPDDHINALAVDNNGTAWIATPGGISRIARKPMTLAEKAAHFEEVNEARHLRDGYVLRCSFDEPGALETWKINASDNDGLYTSMYGASQAFRYAVTKDPEAKRRALRCFDALSRLEAATGIPGFPARCILPVDSWPVDPNERFNEQANLAIQKEDPLWKNIVPRWPKSADGKYWWKCDTSSDEICGHYLFYGAFYDYVAETSEEKQAVVELVRRITNHLVDHNFTLTDHDGKPTRWGNWSPEHLNTFDGWADRGLQSLEMLSFLAVGHHITGDAKFADAAKMLRDKHGYHVNAITGRAVFPPGNVVPWDNNLSYLSYYGLLKYEKDPELLKIYQASMDRNWLFVSGHNDPYFNTVSTVVRPEGESVMFDVTDPRLPRPMERAAETLRDTPYLLIGWEMNNSHRHDIEFDPTPSQGPTKGWYRATKQALPINERSHIRINSDNFDLDRSMGGGLVEYESTYFLLPYYMALHHGYLQ